MQSAKVYNFPSSAMEVKFSLASIYYQVHCSGDSLSKKQVKTTLQFQLQ